MYVQGIPLRNGLHTNATVELGKRALIDTLHSTLSTRLMAAKKRKGAESEESEIDGVEREERVEIVERVESVEEEKDRIEEEEKDWIEKRSEEAEKDGEGIKPFERPEGWACIRLLDSDFYPYCYCYSYSNNSYSNNSISFL